jgi:hypothetical protein
MMISLIVFSDDHHTGSALIQSVNNPRPQNTIDTSEIMTMIEKSIDQGTRRVPISRMNNHSRRLIDDDDGGILIEDGERERFWIERKRFRFRKGS